MIKHNNMFYFISNDKGPTLAELLENSRTNQRSKEEKNQKSDFISTEMKFNIAI